MTLKKQRTWVFTPLDLVAPWGVCLGSVALCIWAIISGKPMGTENPLVPKIITGTVGLLFLLAIPAWYFMRSRLRKWHFILEGIYVVCGQTNKPNKSAVTRWIRRVTDHWSVVSFTGLAGMSHVLSIHQVSEALSGVTLFFADKEKLSVWGRFVRGYSWGKDVVVGYRPGDMAYVESLTVHELSHPVLGYNGEGWNEEHHHKIFAATKLRA